MVEGELSELIKARGYPPDAGNRVRRKLGFKEWSDERQLEAIKSRMKFESTPTSGVRAEPNFRPFSKADQTGKKPSRKAK